jgi:hypothetical protein
MGGSPPSLFIDRCVENLHQDVPALRAEITGELLRKNYMVSNSCQLSSSIHTSEETEPITIFLALPFWTNATLILQSRRALDVHFYPFLFLFYFIFERNGKRFAVNFIRRKICLCSVEGSSHPSPPPWWRNVTFTSVVEIVYPFLIKKKLKLHVMATAYRRNVV